MKDYFKRLYNYNNWANTIILDALDSNKVDDAEILKLISHLIAAQEIWVSRITNRQCRVNGVWNVLSIQECRELAAASGKDWINFVDNISESDYIRIISYKNTQGIAYDTPVVDIMCHAVNHTTYHRAQIAKLLRQKDIAPPNTDFITYARTFALGSDL
jgi:uncharacterized damage-inducible protein DinB